MAHQQMPSSQKALMLELKSLQEEPVEGFRITLVEESDLYNWEVAIFGPPNTLYEGGYFKVSLKNILECLPSNQGVSSQINNHSFYIYNFIFHFIVYLTSIPHVSHSLVLLSPVVRSLYSRSLFIALTDINDISILELKREGQCVSTLFPIVIYSQRHVINCNSPYFHSDASSTLPQQNSSAVLLLYHNSVLVYEFMVAIQFD